MSELYLISTLLMGLLLVTVFMTVAKGGQRATPSGTAGGRSGYAEWAGRSGHDSRVVSIASSPLAWTVSFVLLAIVFLGGAVLLVTDLVPEGAAGLVQTAVMAVGGAVLIGYAFFGAYFAVRERSGMPAAAVGVAAAFLGILLLIAVVLALLFA